MILNLHNLCHTQLKMTTNVCCDTTLHGQIAVTPCSRSSLHELLCPQIGIAYMQFYLLTSTPYCIIALFSVANALNRERATSSIVAMQVHRVSFPIGPFFMSHNCKLFNPSAGKLTVIHQLLCVQTQGGPVKGGNCKVLSIPPSVYFKMSHQPSLILWKSVILTYQPNS